MQKSERFLSLGLFYQLLMAQAKNMGLRAYTFLMLTDASMKMYGMAVSGNSERQCCSDLVNPLSREKQIRENELTVPQKDGSSRQKYRLGALRHGISVETL